MRRRAWVFSVAAIAVWFLLAAAVMAQTRGTAAPTANGSDVAVVLAPLLAAALGIERLLETVWGVVESIMNGLNITPTGAKYGEFKTWASAAFGIVAGIIIASAAQLQMFGMLGLVVDARADVFITGLVIGSGSKFTHDIIGILTEGKRGLEQWRKLTEHRRVNAVAKRPQLKISIVDGE